MSKISDIIEEFILEQLQDTEFINLSRNELANFFNCAPSQINYVLSTRFTEPKGFIIESHRGGGGYIKLTRVNLDKNDYIRNLISCTLALDIDYPTSLQILNNLIEMNIIDECCAEILSFAISPKSLSMPLKIENKQRANILKNVLVNILKGE
jgi:transcriptional regulator CtsR